MKKLILITLIALGCNSKVDQMNDVVDEANKEKFATKFKTETVDGVNIFYREAGDPEKETIVLLHGFPSSSHQYRKVLSSSLADDYHLLAPDYPGFGSSDFLNSVEYEYTFDNIALSINGLLEQLGIDSYVLMIHDYGAPIGFRLAVANPDRVKGIINQNGNAYEEGLGDAWAPLRKLWTNRNIETEEALLGVFSLEGLKWQYTHGTRNPENINPDTWNLDFLRMSRPGAYEINIDLFYDYQNNIKKYPEWQEYLRINQPPLLIVWGKNDAFFPISGAEAFKKDVKNIDFNIIDTGHFALEEESKFIIAKIREFMREL